MSLVAAVPRSKTVSSCAWHESHLGYTTVAFSKRFVRGPHKLLHKIPRTGHHT